MATKKEMFCFAVVDNYKQENEAGSQNLYAWFHPLEGGDDYISAPKNNFQKTLLPHPHPCTACHFSQGNNRRHIQLFTSA